HQKRCTDDLEQDLSDKTKSHFINEKCFNLRNTLDSINGLLHHGLNSVGTISGALNMQGPTLSHLKACRLGLECTA
ncbi:hypothetical protein Nmel_014705, partial [Mimus melanotis]